MYYSAHDLALYNLSVIVVTIIKAWILFKESIVDLNINKYTNSIEYGIYYLNSINYLLDASHSLW